MIRLPACVACKKYTGRDSEPIEITEGGVELYVDRCENFPEGIPSIFNMAGKCSVWPTIVNPKKDN